MGRLPAVIVGVIVLAACQSDTHAVFSPAPSPTPHAAPTSAILQPSDVPATMHVCIGSGPIDVYLSVLAGDAPAVATKDADYWTALRSKGAIAGAVAVYAGDASACKVELGAATNTKSMTSLVVEFADEGEADRAWQSGFFGFMPPPVGEVVTGMTRGVTTGLGVSSFIYSRPPVGLACWRRSVFVALLVTSNIDANTFSAATAAIDPRLN